MILASFFECSLNAWYTEPMLRLLIAAVLGSLIGIEREIRGRDAGFRTQLLVALGSALAMVVSLHFARQFGDANPGASTLRIDPARMAYGVMGGHRCRRISSVPNCPMPRIRSIIKPCSPHMTAPSPRPRRVFILRPR